MCIVKYLIAEHSQFFPPISCDIKFIHFTYPYAMNTQYIVTFITLNRQLNSGNKLLPCLFVWESLYFFFILKDNFPGYWIQVWQFFSLNIFKFLSIVCLVSCEKSAIILIFISL